jgi:hypothetical protein
MGRSNRRWVEDPAGFQRDVVLNKAVEPVMIMESTATGSDNFLKKKYDMLSSTKYRQLGVIVSPIFSWETEPVARVKEEKERAIVTGGRRAIEI